MKLRPNPALLAELGETWSRIVKPPEKLTVSEWADRYRHLSAKESAEAGRWRTARAPYLREIMNACGDPTVDEIVIRKCAQAGCSEAIRNAIGYWATQDPGPVMYVLPDEKAAREVTEERLIPMIRNSLPGEILPGARTLRKHVLRLRALEVYMAWSGSAQALASRPVRFVVMDECDKYVSFSGRDSSPIQLARARARTFAHRRKVVLISTPTLAEAPISVEFELCADKRDFRVPCAECGAELALEWGAVRWPQRPEKTPRAQFAEKIAAEDLARLFCKHCEAELTEADRQSMILAGRWVSTLEEGQSSRRVGFQLNALANPWASLSQLVSKWLKAQEDVGALQEFVNQELGEPFVQTIKRVKEGAFRDKALRHRRNRRGVVPRWAGMLLATVDSQRDGFWFMVRAWGQNYRSQLIEWGFLKSFDQIRDRLLDAYWPVEESEEKMSPRHVLIDAGGGVTSDDEGSMTDRVYRFALSDPARIVPIRGWPGAKRPPRPITMRALNYAPPGAGKRYKVCVQLLDTQFYKDVLASRIAAEDPELWEECEGVDEDYCKQMTSERKFFFRRGGAAVSAWRVHYKGAQNHLWDCAVYQTAGADLAGASFLPTAEQLAEEREQIAEQKQRPRRREQGAGWINRREQGPWIRR